MSTMQEKILAALGKLGASQPKLLAKHIGESASAVGYHLRALVKAGKLKATGKGRGIRYTLGGQKPDTPPPPSRAPKNGKGQGTRAAGDEFTFAMTTDQRLVVLSSGDPLIFTDKQTEHIANLVFANFEAPK